MWKPLGCKTTRIMMNRPRFSTILQQAQMQCSKQYDTVDMRTRGTLIAKFFASGMEYRMSRTHCEAERTFLSSTSPADFLMGFLQGKDAGTDMLQALEEECIEARNNRDYDCFWTKVFRDGLNYEESLLEPCQSTARTWDARAWLASFETAKRQRATNEPRIKVWEDTLAVVRQGKYVVDGVEVNPEFNPDIASESRFYRSVLPPISASERYEMPIVVHKGDCLAFARQLREADTTDDLCVLNLASYSNPGGAVAMGAGAQEEYLFRCTDYYRSLFQYASRFNPRHYGIPQAKERYPLDPNFGGCYSHGVTVFRDTEANGYAYLAKPWKVNFVAAAVSRLPYRMPQIPQPTVQLVINTIRTILRISYVNGQRRLVLGALGCGAFNNPPEHMARLFKQVLNEPEFKGAFKQVYFAIFDDHNATRNDWSNVDAFIQVFEPCRK